MLSLPKLMAVLSLAGRFAGVEAGTTYALLEVVAMHAGEVRRVRRLSRRWHRESPVCRQQRHWPCAWRDEARADAADPRPWLARARMLWPLAMAPERESARRKLAHLADQRKPAQGAGMAAGPGTDENQAINAGLQRLFGMAHADHVMKNLTTDAPPDHRPGRAAERLVMISGTSCFTHSAMSCSRRSLEGWMI